MNRKTARLVRFSLAYIWLTSPTGARDPRENMLNARLLLAGWGTTMVVRPNDTYADVFAQLQREAKEAQRGMWAR
ncbi:MAG: hypothetical protein DDT37_01429 [Firmicutes bacterium]|nr:hypothetical protein [candidate division NPL-UPA2 bacterium]